MARLTNNIRGAILNKMLHTLFSKRRELAVKAMVDIAEPIITGLTPADVLHTLKKHPEYVTASIYTQLYMPFPWFKGDTMAEGINRWGKLDHVSTMLSLQFPCATPQGQQVAFYASKKLMVETMGHEPCHTRRVANPALVAAMLAYRTLLAEWSVAEAEFERVLNGCGSTKALLEKWPSAADYIEPQLLEKKTAAISLRAEKAIKLEKRAMAKVPR